MGILPHGFNYYIPKPFEFCFNISISLSSQPRFPYIAKAVYRLTSIHSLQFLNRAIQLISTNDQYHCSGSSSTNNKCTFSQMCSQGTHQNQMQQFFPNLEGHLPCHRKEKISLRISS